VANKPILFYGIESLVAAGITDLGIIVGDTEEEIRAAVGDGTRWGAKVTYIRQEAPLGLAHAVKIAEPYLKTDAFVMYLGDNLVLDGITAFVEEFKRKQPDALVLLAKVQEPGRFGVAEVSDGRLVRLEEKPERPKSDLALVGVYLFGPKIFTAVNAIKPAERGELEITDAIQYLVDQKARVEPHIIDGWWKDTGRLEDMLEANRIVLDQLKTRNEGTIKGRSQIIGKVCIDAGAQIVDSVVRGPAIIGSGSRITNSYIGPFTSVYHDVEISNSEIEHSIVLERCSIEDVPVRIEASLIGKEVRIQRSQRKPFAYRFMVGDASLVDLL
jgi:glucose-1-phosphate thymidylyltransferase